MVRIASSAGRWVEELPLTMISRGVILSFAGEKRTEVGVSWRE